MNAAKFLEDVIPMSGTQIQMREMGMKQRLFGSHRTLGPELVKLAGSAGRPVPGGVSL